MPACTVTSCTPQIYAALSCTCAATHPNRKRYKWPHPPIFYYAVIHSTVHPRYNSELCDACWLWVSISTTPTPTAFQTSSTILLSSRYKNLDFVPSYLLYLICQAWNRPTFMQGSRCKNCCSCPKSPNHPIPPTRMQIVEVAEAELWMYITWPCMSFQLETTAWWVVPNQLLRSHSSRCGLTVHGAGGIDSAAKYNCLDTQG